MTRHTTALAGAAAVACAVSLAAVPAHADDPRLSLGPSDLPETRSTTTVAEGVTYTRIQRGTPLSDPAQIPTSPTGPWVVHVLRVDPKVAVGRLEATDGPTIAKTEQTTALASHAQALAAVNAGFFTYTANPAYPGDPVGLTIRDGVITSEPTAAAREYDLLFNSATERMTITQTRWDGELVMRNGSSLDVEFLNHPPVVPSACADLPDQRACPVSGDVVRFHPQFDVTTPPGKGVEVVFDKLGCVEEVRHSRGLALAEGQTSLQATGSDVHRLLALGTGCGTWVEELTDADGTPIRVLPQTFAVNGRVLLVEDGKDVVDPAIDDSFYRRNPRTAAGKAADGDWVFFVVEGRSVNSVGTSLVETATVSLDLGLVDALNLDGGGSSTMVVQDRLVNQVMGGSFQRSVGDALVWIPVEE